jgi:hypothetical protein
MFPLLVYSHLFWAALIFMCFYAIYRKYQEKEVEMLKNFYLFFLTWSIPFFGLMATGLGVGYYLGNNMIMSLAYVIPHIFAFTAVGYLWKVQSSINFPRFQNLFWVFVAYGVFIGIYGILNMPEVAIAASGGFDYGESGLSMLIPAGMAISALFIAGSSFYSAYITEGETRKKLSLIGLGTVLCLVVASILNNMGYMIAGEITNLVWISIFVSVAYWNKIQAKYERLIGD